MGLYEKSLPWDARQIDRAGVNKQHNNIIVDIEKRNSKPHFCMEKTASMNNIYSDIAFF